MLVPCPALPCPARLHTPVRPHPRSRAAAARLPPKEVTHSIHCSRSAWSGRRVYFWFTIHYSSTLLLAGRSRVLPSSSAPKRAPISLPLSSFPRFHLRQPFSNTSTHPRHPVVCPALYCLIPQAKPPFSKVYLPGTCISDSRRASPRQSTTTYFVVQESWTLTSLKLATCGPDPTVLAPAQLSDAPEHLLALSEPAQA